MKSVMRIQSKLIAAVMAFCKGLLKEEYISKFTRTVLSRTQFLVDRWTEGLSSLLAVDHRPPSVPCHEHLPIKQLTMW